MKTFTTHDWITAYQKHLGFALCEIPAGGKGPRTPNWGNNPIPYGGYPTTVGIGLIHGRSGTCAIDIDDLYHASDWLASHDIDIQALLDADDAVQIVTGRLNRAKLVYRLPAGCTPLASFKLKTPGGTDMIDFRCVSADGGCNVQDVLPPTIHPETGQKYEWGGKGSPSNIPDLPASLLQLWRSREVPKWGDGKKTAAKVSSTAPRKRTRPRFPRSWEGQACEAMEAAGIKPPPASSIVANGEFHRFSTNGKRNDDAGWYIFFDDIIPAGAFGDFRAGINERWCSKSESRMTPAEKEEIRFVAKHVMEAQRVERLRRHEEARRIAARMWNAANEDCDGHYYLQFKGVKNYGLRRGEWGQLLIPMCDTNGKLHSIQEIQAYNGSKKSFLKDGKTRGMFHAIGKPDGVIVVCEGYATGASIHEATGLAVAAALSAGNLQAVAQAWQQRYPDLRIIVAADDDYATAGNPGRTQAKQAALAVGGTVAAPLFHASRPSHATDFNDLHQLQGLAAVKAVFDELLQEDCHD